MSHAPNPLLADWDAPHGLPPFERFRAEHFAPAFDAALAAHRAEVDAIAANPVPADFDNTVAAFDRSGRLLARLRGVFFNLAASATSPALQAVERALTPKLAAHDTAVSMHAGLFARIDAVHARRAEAGLGDAQRRLVERLHFDLVRAGAQVAPAHRPRYAQVAERLATLQTQFGQNVLHDEEGFRLVLRGEADLAGLPDFVRAATLQAARERGIEDGHLVTLSRSHVVPFLSFSTRRDLREQAWRAWTTRGFHAGAHDNRPVAREILALRHELAQLHGYASFADYALADTMAGSRAAVDRLLDQVWSRATARLAREREALQALVLSQGGTGSTGVDGELQPWDWRFLAEQVRTLQFDVDEAAVKPYLPLPRMVEALFDCAQRLFGLRFVPLPGAPVYHPDVQAYEVRGADGAVRGVFLHDNFARPGKRSGAWMSNVREQMRGVLPIVCNNNNFARGAAGEPTLLSLDDARTLFHEFGHGLHGLLSDVDYERLSGTNVLRDFVELPSQLFEHWLLEPQVLQAHARHWQTGETIPPALVDKLRAAAKFGQGYETVRYCASAIVDMAAHARSEPGGVDIEAFEAEVLARIGAPADAGLNHRLAHFQHLFSGAYYAAGYYVYLWAEVLEADGWDAFVEAGNPFDPAVAGRLQRFIYGAGNSLEPGAAFRAFRGRAPTVEPMLRKRGLVDA
jgi:peptidyl-dipeptidase Dcp